MSGANQRKTRQNVILPLPANRKNASKKSENDIHKTSTYPLHGITKRRQERNALTGGGRTHAECSGLPLRAASPNCAGKTGVPPGQRSNIY